MSESISFPDRAVVARSRYVRLQGVLVVVLVAVIGLAVAVIVLATSQNGTATPASPVDSLGASQSATAQVGARLDHRGLDTSRSASAQAGARLNHRGLDTSQSTAAQVGARLDHRGLQG
jgi:hypothetical protein